MQTKEVTLEDVLAENLEKAPDAGNRVLAIRSYFRWAIISEIFEITENRNLKTALSSMHQVEGLSIRDITARVQTKMRSMLEGPEEMGILQDTILETETLLLQMSTEGADNIKSAMYGSSRPGYGFDIMYFLTNISRNAVSKIIQDLGLQTRGYDERHDGEGYKVKKRLETGPRVKKLWEDPEKRQAMKMGLKKAWSDPKKREAAAERARKQLQDSPAKRAAFKRTKKTPSSNDKRA